MNNVLRGGRFIVAVLAERAELVVGTIATTLIVWAFAWIWVAIP